MGFLDRFIDAMNAASRRMEAKAALIRAETAERSVIAKAFAAGAVSSVRRYSETQREFDQSSLTNNVAADLNAYCAAKREERE